MATYLRGIHVVSSVRYARLSYTRNEEASGVPEMQTNRKFEWTTELILPIWYLLYAQLFNLYRFYGCLLSGSQMISRTPIKMALRCTRCFFNYIIIILYYIITIKLLKYFFYFCINLYLPSQLCQQTKLCIFSNSD